MKEQVALLVLAEVIGAFTALGIASEPARTDRYGDVLPPHAVARLGTTRWRHAEVECVAFSPDGRFLASGGHRNATIFLWDAATGKRLHTWTKQSGFLESLRFSPDGKYLASLATDDTIGLWEVAAGHCAHVLKGQKYFRSIAFSPDSKTLASGNYDFNDSIRLWDVATGKSRFFAKVNGGVVKVAFSPDGKTLAARGDGNIIRLWTIATGEEQRPITLRGDASGVLQFSPNGKVLATGDKKIHLWDRDTGKLLRRLETPTPVSSLCWSQNGRMLAATHPARAWLDVEGAVTVWDVATGTLLRRFAEGDLNASSAAFSPDGKLLASTGWDRIIIWEVATRKEYRPFDGHRLTVGSICISSDGATVATSGGTARLWEANSGKMVHELTELKYAKAVFFAADGKALAIGISDASHHPVDWLPPLPADLNALAAGTSDAFVQVWDIRGRRRIHACRWQAPPHYEGVSAIALSPNGKTLAAAGYDLRIRVWDTATERLLHTLEGHTYSIRSLAFAPDSTVLASSSAFRGRHLNFVDRDSTVRLWEVAAGHLTHNFRPDDYVPCVAFSSDGKTLAAANDDALRDVKTVRVARLLTKDDGFCHCVAFSTDGRMVAKGSSDGLVKVWEAATGREVCRFRGHQDPIESLAFFPDGRTLASGSADTTVLLWDLTLGLCPPRGSKKADQREWQAAWEALSSEEATRAYRAVWILSAAGEKAVPFLDKHLHLAPAADYQRLHRLVTDLDSDQFTERERASEQLKKLGIVAEPALRATLDNKPTLEARRRIEAILESVDRQLLPPPILREIRAVQTLEYSNTPAARRLLEKLAKGPPESRLTEEARKSLNRLTKQPAAKP